MKIFTKITALILVAIMIFSVAVIPSAAGVTASGNCGINGSNVRWSLSSNGTLTISGKGKMKDYYERIEYIPWQKYVSRVKKVEIKNGVTNIVDNSFMWFTNLKTAVIADSVKEIGSAAFYYCENLTFLKLPSKIGNIKELTFYGCKSLKKIEIPKKVRTIGNSAFYECTKLETVIFKNGINSISTNAFACCKKLSSVSLPKSVSKIADSAFAECSSIKSFKVNKKNQSFSTENGVLYNKNKTVLVGYPAASQNTTFIVPDKVSNINSHAFSRAANLEEVTLGKNVTEIGDYAFEYCKKLSSVIFNDGLCNIGNHSFRVCESLTDIVLPDTVNSIGKYAFYDCKKVKTVTLGNGLKNVGENAFDTASKLKGVYYIGTDSEFGKINFMHGNEKITEGKVYKISLSESDINNPEKEVPGIIVSDAFGNVLNEGDSYSYEHTGTDTLSGKYTIKVFLDQNERTVVLSAFPAKTSYVTAVSEKDSIAFKWKKVIGADGYKAELYEENKLVSTVETDETECTFTDLTSAKKYTLFISAYKNTDGEKVYSAYKTEKQAVTVSAPPVLKVQTKGNKVTLNWNDLEGESGYEITFSDSKKFVDVSRYVPNKKADTVKFSDELEKGQTRYFRIRAFTTVNGKKVYTDYSNIVKATIK